VLITLNKYCLLRPTFRCPSESLRSGKCIWSNWSLATSESSALTESSDKRGTFTILTSLLLRCYYLVWVKTGNRFLLSSFYRRCLWGSLRYSLLWVGGRTNLRSKGSSKPPSYFWRASSFPLCGFSWYLHYLP
jgi:hypothetical protein